ncbi:outer membrane receptor for ferrienterochelin and colicins [Frateuria aurantia DSM 6220]|uniref:Outer membrane receptor for ferrienterochelin and colicins n=2 Tax=Frateuria aurantia TaxID=81475 RepID=H8L0Z5_FRAAD|nr:outer membrane receptor for ferrienterochelin and colicins [Frateuria aurantia DSM 6220]
MGYAAQDRIHQGICMKKHPMTLAVVFALATAFASAQAQTTDSTSTDAAPVTKTKARSLDQVNVSGTLINSAQIQTATPTYTITAQDIQARGFNSVAEVLQNSVFATGAVQGPQSSGGFTQGAQTVSLYGLSPEYTLTLIDGKPISQFGQLYNGTSNFTNISNIPLSMIESIDIIPGGGSSIYGSAAIAGTVNIKTKQHMDGGEVLARFGGYTPGGGASQRISASFGKTIGKFSILASAEFDNSDPIWAYQRSLTQYNKTPVTVAFLRDYNTFRSPYTYISPADGCSAMSGLFGGTTVAAHSSVASHTGTYCGSRSVLGYTTLANQSRSYNGMLKLRYDVNDHVRIYADGLLDFQKSKWTAGSNYMWWGPADFGYVVDQATGHYLYPERVFGPEEVGNNYYGNVGRQDDLMYQGDIGANGTFGDSDWNWDLYYMRSGDVTRTSTPERMADAIDSYFLSSLGFTGQYTAGGYPIVNTANNTFFNPLSPAQYQSFMRNVGGFSSTFINNTRATVSTDKLFTLPGGDAGFAWLVEGGSQGWTQPVNPLITDGEIWGTTATAGAGTRGHVASAFELNLPLLKQVTLDLSGRYDRYSVGSGDSGSSNGKFTWKAGLEYRPFESLLLRGNYSTAFLAPDMSSLFLGPTGNYQNVTDYYLCQTQGGGKNCAQDFTEQVQGSVLANSKLKPTTASTWTAGFVWAPVQGLSIQSDFLHISISNEIALQSADQLMRTDSQCRLGALSSTSADCAAAAAQVTRDSLTGEVTNITQYYVNMSNETTNSITSEVKYQFPRSPIGRFGVQLDYNVMLKHDYQQYKGGEVINQLTNPLYSSEFKSIVSGALSWSSLNQRWSSTLYWHRYGATPNYTAMVAGYGTEGAGYLKPWITFNWSLNYSPTRKLDLSLLVNNVMNKMPPRDPTYSSFPYYNSYNYNPYGREIMAQADYRFNL